MYLGPRFFPSIGGKRLNTQQKFKEFFANKIPWRHQNQINITHTPRGHLTCQVSYNFAIPMSNKKVSRKGRASERTGYFHIRDHILKWVMWGGRTTKILIEHLMHKI